MTTLPSMNEILQAQSTIARYLQPTPLYLYAGLSAHLGCHAYIKHENHQPVGAFKVRGGINLLAGLDDLSRSRGVISASTGNHGQSIAYASSLFGVQATIVVPQKSNPDKVKAIKDLGATVVFHGKDFDDAREHAEALSSQQQLRYIHSANEPALIAGVGTIGFEITERLPEVDVIIVPVGGGSGASGVSIAAKAFNPSIDVIGVQSEAAPAAYRSWKEGRPMSSDRMDTFAEGLATRVGFELTVEIMKKNLKDFVLVSDDDIKAAMLLLMEHTHNLVEAAGAASLAGAIQLKESIRGKTIVMILSGANVTLDTLRGLLAR
jgi:threonine dehydratase